MKLAYVTKDNQVFDSQHRAKTHELALITEEIGKLLDSELEHSTSIISQKINAMDFMLKNRDALISLLSQHHETYNYQDEE